VHKRETVTSPSADDLILRSRRDQLCLSDNQTIVGALGLYFDSSEHFETDESTTESNVTYNVRYCVLFRPMAVGNRFSRRKIQAMGSGGAPPMLKCLGEFFA
jgi:hypothetical protein